MPTHRNQSISFLIERFRQVGIRPATRHGQNFLIDLNLQDILVNSANLNEQDVVLEVGTGTGSLTAQIAQQAGAVVTFEIDAQLHQLAKEELEDFDNVTMLQQDVLKNKNHFDPKVIDTVKEQLAMIPGSRFKLVSNLPYNIATPVISNLLRTEIIPISMTVTIQKELADRITASPSTKAYNALSIWMQCQCYTEIVRIMPPSVFWPQPKVTSAIIHVEPDEQLRRRIPDIEFFHTFVRSMFFHRRKFLRSVMLSAFKGKLGKPEVDRVMASLELKGDSRAEQLDIPKMIALCESIRAEVEKL